MMPDQTPKPNLTDMFVAAMIEDTRDVHTEHCCARHGCKYAFGGQNITGDPCTVKSGKKKQSFMCEYCDDELREGGLELAYLMNEMYDAGRKHGEAEGYETGHSNGYDEATHEYKCGCPTPYKFGCTG